MEVQNTNRIVAIVGRPNVGKSALFNRIVGRRISIVHEQVGVTRDRVSAEAEHNGHRFELIDTGGLGHFDKQVADDVITASTEAQAEIAITDAGLILFVVDITAGLVPHDEEVARLLHCSGRPVLMLLANKADNPHREDQIIDFDGLGFPTFSVSAIQNRGIEPLLASITQQLPEMKNQSVGDSSPRRYCRQT